MDRQGIDDHINFMPFASPVFLQPRCCRFRNQLTGSRDAFEPPVAELANRLLRPLSRAPTSSLNLRVVVWAKRDKVAHFVIAWAAIKVMSLHTGMLALAQAAAI